MPDQATRAGLSRVLIVEDDDAQRALLTTTLERDGYEVAGCGLASEALALAQRSAFGAAVVDLHLPDLPGMQLVERLHAVHPLLRVIVHTAHASFESVRDSLHLGAFAYVEKLSDPGVLLHHVHRAFREQMAEYAEKLEAAVAERTAGLRNSEARYRALVEQTPVVTYTAAIDQTSSTVYVSPQIKRYIGYTPAEYATDPNIWCNALHPQDRERVLAEVALAHASGEPFGAEYRMVARDGRVVWFRDEAAVVRDGNGQPVCLQGTMVDITAWKEAEDALRRSEARYRRIVETANEGIWAVDADLRTSFVNARLAQMLGYSVDEMLGRTVTDFTYAEDRPDQEARIRQGQGGEPATYERRFRRRDGSTCWAIVSSTPQRDENGGFTGWFAMLTDITERKRAEETVRENEARLSMAQEVSGAGVWEWNVDRDEVSFDKWFHAMLGYAPGELPRTAREWKSYHHPDDLPGMMARIEAYFRGEQPVYESEHRIRTKTGTWRWVFTRGKLVDRTASGYPRQFVGMAVDVTERKRAEEVLRASEERFAKIFRASPVGLAITRLSSGHIIDANLAFLNILGYSRDELIGRTTAELNLWADEADRADLIDELRRDGRVRNREVRYRAKSGTIGNVLMSLELIELGGEQVMLSIAMDVTERKRTEEELARYRDHLEELVERRTREVETAREQARRADRLASLGTFAAGIAHEINNPLGMMLLGTETALANLHKPELVTKMLHENMALIGRCAHIAQGVLDFSRKQFAEKRVVDLNEIVRHGVEFTRKPALKQGVTVRTSLATPLSPMLGNAVELEQVVVNLVQNAVQACGDGGQVTIETEDTGDKVRLVVQDNGCGMTPEQLQRVFDPFFTTRLETGGTGLGLSVVHGIVADHEGSIQVASEKGRGTTFTIEFRRYSVTEADDGQGTDR